MAGIGPLRTQTDIELQGAPRGDALAGAVADRRARQGAGMAAPYAGGLEPATGPMTLTWGDLQQRHPEWQGATWAECRALYAGGPRLLQDREVLERLFPRHMHEIAAVYEQRKARAHYFPYAGTIIDHLLAGLGTDPLVVSFAETDDKGATTLPAAAEWWERWVRDVTDEAERPADYGLEDTDDEDDDEGGRTMHHFLVDVLREALQTRTAWVLADLPEAGEAGPEPTSALDLEQGRLDPYLCLIPAEQVIDWNCDDRGKPEWVLILTCRQVRATPRDRRGKVLHVYTLWTAESWARYEVLVDPRNLPTEQMPFAPVRTGAHGFGRVPLERLELPEGMYAMGKLHSLAREHFNKRCAMSWAEYKSLFPVLYEFHGAEDKQGLPVAAAQADENRATNQLRGQGYTQTRGNEDRAEYVGPPSDPFVAARDSCSDTMREMHRVMFSMAMSANMDKAALTRSAESKSADNATTEVLLDAFGTILTRFARRLLLLAALGRGEAAPPAQISGYAKFDVAGVDSKIAEAVQLFAGVPMLSSLIKELYLAQLYGDIVGGLTPEQVEEVREQIREGLSAEEMAAAALAGMGTGPSAPTPGDDEGDNSEPAPEPAARAAPAPGGTRPLTRRMAKR